MLQDTANPTAPVDMSTCGTGYRLPAGRRRGDAHLKAEAAAAAFEGLPPGEDRFAIIRLLERVGGEIGVTASLLDHMRLLVRMTEPQDWRRGARPLVWLSV